MDDQEELNATLEHIHVEYFETGEATDPVGKMFFKDMPNPSDEEISSAEFDALWDVVKKWDVNVPEYYHGYCGANGSHVKLLLDAIKPFLKPSAPVKMPRF